MSEIQKVVLHKSGPGKFVQLIINDGTKEIPLFVSRQRPCLHAEALSMILDQLGVEYQFEIDKLNGNAKIPSKTSENYRVVGAGNLEIFESRKILVIDYKSNSAGYDVGFNKEHFEQVKGYFPEGLEVKKHV